VDRIDLSAFGLIAATLWDNLSTYQDGADTIIGLPDHDKTIRLVDFALADLDESDFLL